MQPQSIARGRAFAGAAALLAVGLIMHGPIVKAWMVAPGQGSSADAAPPTEAPPTGPADGLRGWTESPGHVRLFAPASQQASYRAYVTREPLDAVLGRLRAEARNAPPGAWAVETLPPLDAFGRSGSYSAFRVSRLFVQGPLHVARGPRVTAGGLEAWTLLSPYPDPSLTRLDPGTLLIALRVPPL